MDTWLVRSIGPSFETLQVYSKLDEDEIKEVAQATAIRLKNIAERIEIYRFEREKLWFYLHDSLCSC